MADRTKPRLHYGDPPGNRLAATTFCGRLLTEVVYWGTPEVARHMTFAPRCTVCVAALLKRQRP